MNPYEAARWRMDLSECRRVTDYTAAELREKWARRHRERNRPDIADHILHGDQRDRGVADG